MCFLDLNSLRWGGGGLSLTDGRDDGTTEEGSGGHVPVAGDVLRQAGDIHTRFHRRLHFLWRKVSI